MASKLIERLKCDIARSVSLAVFQGEKNVFFTFQKTRKKESGEWEDVPFYSHQDLAALYVLIPRALAIADENRIPRSYENGEASQAKEPAPLPKSLDDDDINF